MIPWINIELTNDCNKACSFCGRAQDRKDHKLDIGHIKPKLVKKIAREFTGSIVQVNKDGEPMLWNEDLRKFTDLFPEKISNIVTNGILLYERKEELLGFTSITVSVIEDDVEQFETIKRFSEFNRNNLGPLLFVKFLGDYDNPEFRTLGIRTMRRTIHHPKKDSNYRHGTDAIPEIGICLDLLMKPAIDWKGFVHICNRYDPKNLGVVGNINNDSLETILNGFKRSSVIASHMIGNRTALPLCNTCQFWGIPRVE